MESTTTPTSGATETTVTGMTGAWNHAYGRASVLVERLARLRADRIAAATRLEDANRILAAELADLTSQAASAKDEAGRTNDMVRRAALITLQDSSPSWAVAREDAALVMLEVQQIDAEITSDHDRLMLLRAEMAWLTATASQQREEAIARSMDEVAAQLQEIRLHGFGVADPPRQP